MSKKSTKNTSALSTVLQFLLIMYGVQIANIITNNSLKHYGIHPRDASSIWCILTSPFIHSGWGHLLNNTLCFVVFSSLCLMRGTAYYLKVSLFIIIIGGLGVWAFGRPAIHIGASGWIFGLWSLIIANAWFERSFLNIIVSIAMIVFYGGMIVGVVPTEEKISFEAHLFGAIAGVVASSLFTLKKRAPTSQP
jgi:membrane associated rhomboid family serine protease